MNANNISKQTSIASLILMPRSISNQSRVRGRGLGGGIILVADVLVLAAGLPLKHAMPILIQSNLPHITLQFGTNLDCPNCLLICCAVDSCAALMTGNFHFFGSVAKRFPHCVAKIYTPEDYAPIVLSGIMQSNKELVTTELEVGILFHLPYKTREGNSASLMVATGPNVSINTIIGLPFMKATGVILDVVDEVVDCKYLDCPLFPVDFHRTSNHVPVMDKPRDTPAHHATSYTQLIKEVENIKRYYEARVLASGLTLSYKGPAVRFGSRLPVHATVIDHNSSSAALQSTADMSTRWVPPRGMTRIMTITTLTLSSGRMGYCELQPAGHCNVLEHSLHCAYVVSLCLQA
jgi:hypothetical protein